MSVRRLEALLKERVLLAAELGRANAELAELADTDPVTGLASKRSLVRTMARDLARAGRSGAHLSVLRVDIDSFEAVNDAHGPIAGEGVLRAVAGVLRGIVCSGDLASRLGGAEFAVLLPDTPLREAVSLAERARVALAEVVVETPAGPIRITASFGAAARTSPDDDVDVDGILSRAHDALCSAGVRPVERAA